MAELRSIAVAFPSHVVTLEDTKARVAEQIDEPGAVARYQRMAEQSRIATRHIAVPLDVTVALRTIEERQTHYARHALELSLESATSALRSAGIAPDAVRFVVSVSCTGYMMPSLEAHLAHQIGIHPAARRVPITELGCSGAVAAVGIARELLRGEENGASALVVATELSSLCLQTSEPSISDVVGGLLFGDASASVVIAGSDEGRGPRVLASRSVLWPETALDLGMRLTTTGFRLELSPQVPRLVRRHLRTTVEAFLAEHQASVQDIAFWAIHPGGPKLLEAIGESLALSDEALRPSWRVWERRGNVSSATALVILRDILEAGPPAGALGMLLAPGPGLSCEMVLLRASG